MIYISSLELIRLGHTLKGGRTIPELTLEEAEKIRKEAQDSTKIAWCSLIVSVVAVIVSVVAVIVAFIM